MTTKTRKVTKAQATKVLNAVAAYLGRKGLGVAICPQGLDVDWLLNHPDGSPCDTPTFTPAPTGDEAAHKGLGPMLNMAYEGWNGPPRPAIILEGGPYDWPVEGSYKIQQALDAAGVNVFVEPINGYSLGIYQA
jgi:hypothetical protein